MVRSKRASLSRKPFNLNKIFQIKYEQGDDQKRDMNDFRIRRKPLGKGSYGEVKLARDLINN